MRKKVWIKPVKIVFFFFFFFFYKNMQKLVECRKSVKENSKSIAILKISSEKQMYKNNENKCDNIEFIFNYNSFNKAIKIVLWFNLLLFIFLF